MVDISKIQLNPIPPPIAELLTANTALKGENKLFRNIMIGLVIGGVIGIGLYIYKSKSDEP